MSVGKPDAKYPGRKTTSKAHRSGGRGQQPIRLLLVDDHEVSLAALKHYLASRTRFQVATLPLDRIEAIQQSRRRHPHVVLINLLMPRFDGVSVTRLLVEATPGAKVIGFGGPEDKKTVSAMLRAGAHGYVVRTCSAGELIQAVETVSRGGLFFSAAVLRIIAEDYAVRPPHPVSPHPGGLTDRDRKIVALIADGCCNKEIAGALGVSVRTIEKYRETLMAKLQIKSISGLTKFAIRNGISQLD